jgi:Na+-translocating ferredoxin:NAD+ oxidoreductase RnfD subunit
MQRVEVAPTLLNTQFRSARRFMRSPKGHVLLLLSALTALGLIVTGTRQSAEVTALAVTTAVGLDIAFWAVRKREFVAPSGALLTGLIVALVLSPIERWYIVVLTAAIAIASKHLLRTRWSNIFNPAALAIVVVGFALGSVQSWWGALPDAGLFGALEVALLGVLIVNQINKFPLVLSFLGVYYGLFTLATFVADPAISSEVFRSPDVHAALFFAVFMLDDPPTSPVRYVDQVIFGTLVACVSYAVFLRWGPVYYLSAGLLVGNAWESVRRYLQRSVPAMPAPPMQTPRGTRAASPR